MARGKRKTKPYRVVKLKTAITHVEVIKEKPDALGRICVMAGPLTGWLFPEEYYLEI